MKNIPQQSDRELQEEILQNIKLSRAYLQIIKNWINFFGIMVVLSFLTAVLMYHYGY